MVTYAICFPRWAAFSLAGFSKKKTMSMSMRYMNSDNGWEEKDLHREHQKPVIFLYIGWGLFWLVFIGSLALLLFGCGAPKPA
jgi:hypothetical protein